MTFIIIIRYPIVLFADMFNVIIICFNNYEMVQGDIKLMKKKLDWTLLDSLFRVQEYYQVRFLTRTNSLIYNYKSLPSN